MTRFGDYATRYQTIRMERRDGILQMTFHTNGGPLQWGLLPHGEFPQAFRDVGSDPENKIVIITGTGDTYSGPRAAGGTGMRSTPAQWDRVYWEGKHLLMSLLDIEVPMISAINGPAWRHSEIPLLCDIVLAADDGIRTSWNPGRERRAGLPACSVTVSRQAPGVTVRSTTLMPSSARP